MRRFRAALALVELQMSMRAKPVSEAGTSTRTVCDGMRLITPRISTRCFKAAENPTVALGSHAAKHRVEMRCFTDEAS